MNEPNADAARLQLQGLESLVRGEHPSTGLADLAGAVAATTGADAVIVLYRPHRGGELVLAGTHGLEDETRRRALLPLARELGGWVERTRGPAGVAGAADARFPSLAAAGVAAARAVPLRCGGRVLGALVAVSASHDLPEFDPFPVALAALGLRHWAWEEEARRAVAQRDEAERLRLRVESAAAAFEGAEALAREIRAAARASARITERLGVLEDPELRDTRDLLNEQLARIDRVASQLVETGEDRAAGRTPCDLGDLVEAALDLVEPQLRAKRIRVSRRIGASVPFLVLDPDLVRRVLANLLEAVGEGTPVKGRLKVELTRRGSTAEIWVAADGAREPGAVLDALWAPFLAQDPARGFSVVSAREFLAETGARLETRTEPDWSQSYRLHIPIVDNRDRRGRDDRRRHRERRA